MNITNLFTIGDPQNVSDFEIVHVSQAEQIYPQPEYVFANDLTTMRVVIEKFLVEALIDEESKKTFHGYWLGKISNQLGEIVYSNTPHYICAGFIPERGAIVFECGVFDSSTATIFSQMGCKVYGFEMDKKNYEIARRVGEEKNFVVENLGLGSFKHKTTYTHTGNPGASYLDSNETDTTTITTLDSYVRENNLPRVDFIKMDVEGAELDILKGATATIARFKPILALSAYHKLDDFWTLMNFVKSVRPDYEFAMRHYPWSREDVPFMFQKGQEEFFYSLGLDVRIPVFVECVLFAR